MEPHSQDIYVADSGNNRIRLIFSQIGTGLRHDQAISMQGDLRV